MICKRCDEYFNRSEERTSKYKHQRPRSKLCPKCWNESVRVRRKGVKFL